MTEQLRGKDYITTQEWTNEEIEIALETATELKEKFKRGEPHRLLPDKTIFLLFFDKSTRTRNSFEAGITQLGGHAHFISAETSQISHGESPKDTGIILSSYGHGIAIRHDLVPGEGNAFMREVAQWAEQTRAQHAVRYRSPVPNIGGLDDDSRSFRQRLARAQNCRVVGLCAELRQADVGAARLNYTDDTLRTRRYTCASARIQVDGFAVATGTRKRRAARCQIRNRR